MSIPVALASLGSVIEERSSSAYLLTVCDDGFPHAVHVPVRMDGDALVVGVGKRSAANADARPWVSLLFPARADGDYSLIVDGTAVVSRSEDGQRIRVTPTRAVLHRPAAVPDAESSCAADCVPLLPAPPGRTLPPSKGR